ncbi:uncharacterized protein LOC124308557 [Neodiprion virginianus]|uniref:uncharacterized protein LOC124308557 n=1 Tax=Neodiprion virginianus TaxID=2961670 RepID=UPI001EE7035B|nr:uncharacterized protein LOC124308557 [Neodiprion virginianus]
MERQRRTDGWANSVGENERRTNSPRIKGEEETEERRNNPGIINLQEERTQRERRGEEPEDIKSMIQTTPGKLNDCSLRSTIIHLSVKIRRKISQLPNWSTIFASPRTGEKFFFFFQNFLVPSKQRSGLQKLSPTKSIEDMTVRHKKINYSKKDIFIHRCESRMTVKHHVSVINGLLHSRDDFSLIYAPFELQPPKSHWLVGQGFLM